jgi:hypothetical protein
VRTTQFHVNVGDPEPEDFVELAPGDSVTRRYELTRFYPFGVPGRYVVRACFTNVHLGPRADRPAWTGSLTSNAVELQRIR